MSIAAMNWEIECQPDGLAMFADNLRRNRIPLPVSSVKIFTGSGDSWAAALFAREIANGEAFAEDPYEMSAKPAFARNKTIIPISVSGRTRASIEMARKIRRRARKIIAVTSDKKSPLARTCDASIILQYSRAGPLTSGTASFTASLLACTSLLGKLPGGFGLEESLQNARKMGRLVRLPRHGLSLFVGSGVDRAIAEYGACKAQEVLGFQASAAYPEQVGHALLFSLNPHRDAIVCIDSLRDGKMEELYEHLSRSGFNAYRITTDGKDLVVNSLEACFYIQCIALFNARRYGLKDCVFLRDRSRLGLSNKLIY